MDILDDDFISNRELSKEEKLKARLFQIDIKNSFKDLKYGRIALFVTAALFLLGTFLSANYNAEMVDKKPILIEGFVFFIILTLSAVYVPKKPLVAIGIGCGFYFLNILITTLADPMTLVRGIIFKAVLIYFLVKGLHGAWVYQKAAKGLLELGEEIPSEFKFD